MHILKAWPEPFEAVWRGEKMHELRLDDRGFLEGDRIRLREWDPATGEYSGRTVDAKISYLRHAIDVVPAGSLSPGYVIFSFMLTARSPIPWLDHA